MLQSSKLLPSTRLLQVPRKPPQSRHIPATSPPAILNNLSRRGLAKSSFLFLLTSQPLLLPGISRAEEEEDDDTTQTENKPREAEEDTTQTENKSRAAEEEDTTQTENKSRAAEEVDTTQTENKSRAAEEEDNTQTENTTPQVQPNPVSPCDKLPTKRAFLDVSVNGEPVGRIIIGLYGDSAPFGASRFGDLVSGRAGISYRRKEFTKIMPNYVQHGGVRSYGVDAELARTAGKDLKSGALKEEWEKAYNECQGTKNLAWSVGIVVRDPSKPPPKVKLVARKGRLEMDEEEVGVEPNGTEFVISTRDSPELDGSVLVVGRVLQGMDVVEKIGQVKTVQENTTSPYFRVAKLIGDKRAVVAERGFNRPYSKVIVTNCGLLD